MRLSIMLAHHCAGRRAVVGASALHGAGADTGDAASEAGSRGRALRAVATVVLSMLAGAAGAQGAQGAYPLRPITIVVPFSAGGSTDAFARQLAKGLTEGLKQTVIVDNRPGAGGSTGTAHVAKAPADGYTLVLTSSSLSTYAAVQPRLAPHPQKSLAPVALFATAPFVLIVSNAFPAATPTELLAELRRRPGHYSYASAGPGSTNHFATEMFKAMSATSIVHVPYRGATPAMTDLVGGQVQLTFSTGPSVMPYVRSGRARAIAISSAASSPVAPQLQPLAGAVPGYAFEQWFGLLAPAGTPPEVVSRLNEEVNKIVTGRTFAEHARSEGAVAQASTPAQFAAVIAAELAQFTELARRQKILPE